MSHALCSREGQRYIHTNAYRERHLALRNVEEIAASICAMASYDSRPRATRSLEYPPLRPSSGTTSNRPTANRPTANRTAARKGAAVPAGPTQADHQATAQRLKGVAMMATAVTFGMFGAFVVTHPVGSASLTGTTGTGGGATNGTTGGATNGTTQGVTAADPFFDPNPGSGAGQVQAPVFGSGGGSPVLRSSGS
jgi:hypothetical protein